jgi:hypothetical protein
MPHPANRLIVDRMVVEGWFRNPQREISQSDNWWQVEDAHGRTALLYVVRFMSDSARGAPKKIPNTPAVPRIAELHREKGRAAGPFIALAEASDPGATPDIVSIRVWRLFAQHLSGAKRVPVEELGAPIFAC